MPPNSFAPGMRVLCRDAEWIVRRHDPLVGAPDQCAVRCVGADPLVRGHEAVFLTTLDEVVPVRPEDTRLVADDSPGYRRARLSIEAHLRSMPHTADEPDLERMGVFDTMPFQQQAVEHALKQPRVRLLLADGVGLGKTIQVGMILSELARRGRATRVLTLTKKSMLSQFQSELWNRFGFPLTRLDSKGIQRLRLRIPSNKNPFEVFARVIISIDTLKDLGRYAPFLEQTSWDVVIIDEAHNVAGASVPERHKSYRLARLLSRQCENMLLTTATPHNGRPETFGRLISLLEPFAIADPDLREYTPEEIGGYFLMRFKEDVRDDLSGHLPERIVIPRQETSAAASAPEEAVYRHLATMRAWARRRKNRSTQTPEGETSAGRSHTLVEYGLYKLFLSSPESCRSTTRKRLEKGDGVSAEERALLSGLLDALDGLTLETSTRFQLLMSALERIGCNGSPSGPRVVIFTEYRETQEALFRALTKRFAIAQQSVKPDDQPTQPIAIMNGSFTDEAMMKVVDAFSTGTAPLRILIATDVASEGINLHHQCHHLVHFDLPWSIITLIQRTGRVDRYGQQHQPEIRYLMVRSQDPHFSGDDHVFGRLIDKVEEINRTRRSGESVLNLYDPEAEARYIGERGILEGDTGVLDNGVVSHGSREAPDPQARLLEDLIAQVRLGTLRLDEAHSGATTYARSARLRYLDDDAFLRDGYQIIRAAEGLAAFRSEEQRLIFTAPPDLRRYLGAPGEREFSGYTAIPEEAYPPNHEFHLTLNRAHADEALTAARYCRGGWSQVSYLTDQHPIVQWITERLLLCYPRGEAPYLTSRHLGAGTLCYLFVGQVCAIAGNPIFSEAHAVILEKGGHYEVKPALDAFSLRAFSSLVNDGQARNLSAAQQFLPGVVAESLRYLKSQRTARNETLAPVARRLARRAQEWERRRRDFLSRKIEALPARHPSRRHLETQYEELEKTRAARESWLKDRYFAESEPTTRLIAVIEGEEGN